MNTPSPWIAIGIGMTIGGFVPLLWGADVLSMISLLFTAIGAFIGLWVHHRLF